MIEVRQTTWQGLEGLSEEILAETRPKVERAVKAALLYAEGELKTTLTGARSGRAYVVSKTGKLHIASAPGEAPAVLYGNLRNSAGHSDPKWEGDVCGGEWGIGLGVTVRGKLSPEAYARRLEYGGVSVVPRDVRVKIEGEWRLVKAGTIIRTLPRPYMAPTELRIRPIVEKMFEATV